MQKLIYIIGNPLLEHDNMPLKFMPSLQREFPDIDFVILDPNENIKPIEKSLNIIDTVDGVNKIIKISDTNILETDDIYSPHDFDLSFNLKLLHKIGQLEKINIFGVPNNINFKTGLRELISMIKDSWDEL